MNWLLWFGLIVATYRTSRLLVKDEFPPTRALRDWVISTFAETAVDGELIGGRKGWGLIGFSIAYVFTCMWCMSIYVSVALWWIAVALGFSVPLPWLLVAAASSVTGALGDLGARLDLSYELADAEAAQLIPQAGRYR
jgi:hypothetical protein